MMKIIIASGITTNLQTTGGEGNTNHCSTTSLKTNVRTDHKMQTINFQQEWDGQILINQGLGLGQVLKLAVKSLEWKGQSDWERLKWGERRDLFMVRNMQVYLWPWSGPCYYHTSRLTQEALGGELEIWSLRPQLTISFSSVNVNLYWAPLKDHPLSWHTLTCSIITMQQDTDPKHNQDNKGLHRVKNVELLQVLVWSELKQQGVTGALGHSPEQHQNRWSWFGWIWTMDCLQCVAVSQACRIPCSLHLGQENVWTIRTII